MQPEVEEHYVNVMEDNAGAIKLSNNPISSYRTKHIDVRHHFLGRHAQGKGIKIIPVGRGYQYSAVMTKALDDTQLKRHMNMIMTM